MDVMGMGIDYATGGLLIQPMSGEEFSSRIKNALDHNAPEVEERALATRRGVTAKRELEMRPTVEIRDPRAAGWTFLVNGDDPHRQDLIEAIRPLAKHRGMANPSKPLLYDADKAWSDWLLENYTSLDTQQLPHYILVMGGPGQVPFHFQALLDVAASVGRVAFDTVDDLTAYVGKVIRLESPDEPPRLRKALFFAPDYGTRLDGSPDPTYYSRRYIPWPPTPTCAATLRDR